jgi:hypothetical protein
MRSRRSRNRVTAWRLAIGFGVLLAIVFLPFHACAQPSTIGDCKDSNLEIHGTKARLCFRSEQQEWVWVKAAGGTNFGLMARACCTQYGTVDTLWKRRFNAPKADLWYPVESAFLKTPLLEKVRSASRPAAVVGDGSDTGENGRDINAQEQEQNAEENQGGSESEGVVTKVNAPQPGPGGGTEGGGEEEKHNEDGKPETQSKGEEGPFGTLFVGAVVLSFVIVCGLLLWVVITLNRIARHLERSGFPTGQPELKEIAAALADPLADAVRRAVAQKSTVEIDPPTALTIPEWDPFLRRVREVLGYQAPLSGSEVRTTEASGKRSEAVPALGSTREAFGAISQRKFEERRYVQRYTTYGPESPNFGGDVSFEETPVDRAPFFVELSAADEGSGFLFPNPSTGVADPLYQRLFNLRYDQLKDNSADPRPVKRVGRRWVLDLRHE